MPAPTIDPIVPAAGNPIGLGLLFATATPLGLLLLAVGLVRSLLRSLREPGRS